jgi:hypothetical protein
MSHVSATSRTSDLHDINQLCTSIRGKLQFMDYLVRAAVADIQRLQDEDDQGTRIFLRQLVEMHAQNLAVECENMRLMTELCRCLEAAVAETCDGSVRIRNGDAA